MIDREINVSVELTPEELAFEFCTMRDCDQALFFNAVAELSEKWPNPYCAQMRAVGDSQELTASGRIIMQEIGDAAISDHQRKLEAGRTLGIRDEKLKTLQLVDRSNDALRLTIQIMSESHATSNTANAAAITHLRKKVTSVLKGKAKANTRADAAEAKVKLLQKVIDDL